MDPPMSQHKYSIMKTSLQWLVLLQRIDMGPHFTLLLLKVMATVIAGKYVFVPSKMDWSEAQLHCRAEFTDLAPVSSEHDIRLIQKLNLTVSSSSWIGLMTTTNSSSGWMWSGGGEVTTFFWNTGEPNDVNGVEQYGAIMNKYNYPWFDTSAQSRYTVLCYKVHVIRMKMSWEDALLYCRQNHRDLASVASETEMMLIEKELRKNVSTSNVWIGLRYLAGEWLWVDGQTFNYDSWRSSSQSTCPAQYCGAVHVERANITGKVEKVEQFWVTRDCSKQLYFLCY